MDQQLPVDEIRGVGRPKKAKTAIFFEPVYISELLLDSSDESDDDNEADAAANVVAADVVASADNAADEKDHDENTGEDASDLETELTVPKTSTTEKVAVPKTSKKRGPRGPYKKNPNNSFFTQLNYYIIISKLLYYYINY